MRLNEIQADVVSRRVN